jgi:hypothetical protein
VNTCAYHSKVDVSDITGNANQFVLYSVIPSMTQPCAACQKYATIGTLMSMMSSHELEEIVVNESLGDLKDSTKIEVADICAVII